MKNLFVSIIEKLNIETSVNATIVGLFDKLNEQNAIMVTILVVVLSAMKLNSVKASAPYKFDTFDFSESVGKDNVTYYIATFKGKTNSAQIDSYKKVATNGFKDGEFGQSLGVWSQYIPWNKDKKICKCFVFKSADDRQTFYDNAKAYGEWYNANVKGKKTTTTETGEELVF